MKKFILYCIFIFSICYSYSQVETVSRIEMEYKDAVVLPLYYTFGELGVLQRTKQAHLQKENRRERVISLALLNNELKKTETGTLSFPKRQANILIDTSKQRYFELAFDRRGNYSLYSVQVQNLSNQKMSGTFPRNFSPSHMFALNNGVYVVGSLRRNPMVLHINMNTKSLQVLQLPVGSGRNYRIQTAHVDAASNNFFVFMSDIVNRKPQINLLVFNKEQRIHNISLPYNEQHGILLSPHATVLQDGAYLLIGTYASRLHSETASGLGVIKIKNSTIDFAAYHSFMDIKNFTSHLSERQQERLERRKNRRWNQGRELELNYAIQPHRIKEENNNYTLIGEAYYSTYRTDCQPAITTAGTRQDCRTVFDGYKYTHYFLLHFDAKGNYIWSNSKPMNIEYKPLKPIKFVHVTHDNDYIAAVYASGHELHYNRYKQGSLLESATYSFTESFSSQEEIRRASTYAQFWYNTYFIAHGVQDIRNREERERRRIYYLNKLQIRTTE